MEAAVRQRLGLRQDTYVSTTCWTMWAGHRCPRASCGLAGHHLRLPADGSSRGPLRRAAPRRSPAMSLSGDRHFRDQLVVALNRQASRRTVGPCPCTGRACRSLVGETKPIRPPPRSGPACPAARPPVPASSNSTWVAHANSPIHRAIRTPCPRRAPCPAGRPAGISAASAADAVSVPVELAAAARATTYFGLKAADLGRKPRVRHGVSFHVPSTSLIRTRKPAGAYATGHA